MLRSVERGVQPLRVVTRGLRALPYNVKEEEQRLAAIIAAPGYSSTPPETAYGMSRLIQSLDATEVDKPPRNS